MRRTTFATTWALKSQDKPMEGPKILKQYQHYEDIFSEEKAKRFPPSRDENMNIKFVPGAPMNLNCKIYPLNAKEQAWMIKQIGKDWTKILSRKEHPQ